MHHASSFSETRLQSLSAKPQGFVQHTLPYRGRVDVDLILGREISVTVRQRVRFAVARHSTKTFIAMFFEYSASSMSTALAWQRVIISQKFPILSVHTGVMMILVIIEGFQLASRPFSNTWGKSFFLISVLNHSDTTVSATPLSLRTGQQSPRPVRSSPACASAVGEPPDESSRDGEE